MSLAKACPHLTGQIDLEVVHVLDSHLHPTDGFARCRRCGAAYLFEMADISGDVSVFRLSAIAPEAMTATVRSLNKGSCDINRATSEVFSLANDSAELEQLLVMRAGAFCGVVPRPRGRALPRCSWRELDMNGSLIDALGLTQVQARS